MKPSPVRHFDAEDRQRLSANPSQPIPAKRSQPRDSYQQIDALLSITDRQIRNLEAADLLSNQEARALVTLADVVTSLHRALAVKRKDDDDPADKPDWSSQAK